MLLLLNRWTIMRQKPGTTGKSIMAIPCRHFPFVRKSFIRSINSEAGRIQEQENKLMNPKGTRKSISTAALLAALSCFSCSAAEEAVIPDKNKDQGRFIDAHVHFHACKPGELDKAAEWMKSNNVQRIINYPLAESRPKNDAERKQMLENYAKYKGSMGRACVIFPEEVNSVEEAVKLLAKEKEDGAVAFGEHYGGGLEFDDPRNLRLYEACAKVGLPVMIHMGGKGLPALERVLKLYPDCMIIAHSSAWWRYLPDGSCDRLLKIYPNLYADISCSSKSSLLIKDKKFGKEFLVRNADKLLFGSDNSWSSLGGKSGVGEFALIDDLALPADVEDKICRKNAERLFFSHSP